jgi:hypothetical protein
MLSKYQYRTPESASCGEIRDKVEVAVDATTEEGGDVRVAPWRTCPSVPSSVTKFFSFFSFSATATDTARGFIATARSSSRIPQYTSPYPPWLIVVVGVG